MGSHEVSSGVRVATIREAADLLGVSPDAIRQRIRRGTIPAEKIAGVWHVQVEPSGSVRPSHEASREASGGGVLPSVHPHVQGGVQGHVHPGPRAVEAEAMADVVGRMLAPALAAAAERESALAERLGRAEQERDALRAEVERMRTAADAAATPPEAPGRAEAAAPVPRPPRSLWGRLKGLLGG